MSPFLPEEKSKNEAFWSLTKKEGVFSALKGESPFHSRPALWRRTRLPTTAETGSRALISSRTEGGNFILLYVDPERPKANRRSVRQLAFNCDSQRRWRR